MFHKAVDMRFLDGTALEVVFQDGKVKRYDMAALGGMGKKKYRELHWKDELKQAHDAGCRMAEAILTK